MSWFEFVTQLMFGGISQKVVSLTFIISKKVYNDIFDFVFDQSFWGVREEIACSLISSFYNVSF